jgi:AbiV family abortive infection protein
MSIVKRFKGVLTPKECAIGIEVCLENAGSLLQEAQILFEHGKNARANFLALTSVEELGKISILTALMITPDSQESSRLERWAEFYKHGEKFKNIVEFVFFMHWVTDPNIKVNKVAQHPAITELARMASLYVEYSPRTKKWRNPNELIPKLTAEGNIRSAKELHQLFYTCKTKNLFNPDFFEIVKKYIQKFINKAKSEEENVAFYQLVQKNKILAFRISTELMIELFKKKIVNMRSLKKVNKELEEFSDIVEKNQRSLNETQT